MSVAVIVAAAGRGLRMKGSINKQYLPLSGRPVVAHTLAACLESACFSQIIAVVTPGEEDLFRREVLLPWFSQLNIAVVTGGKERQDSVANGLRALSAGTEYVCIHDGARPLVTPQLLRDCLNIASEHGAAIAAVPVKDTVKLVNEGVVLQTPPRAQLWTVHTPQVFRRDWLEEAYARAGKEGFCGTDDAALLERYGYTVHVVRSDYQNIKITTPEDLILAELLLGQGDR